MIWIIAMVLMSLVMSALTIANLVWPLKATVVKMPDQIFAAVTFTVILIYGLTLLAAKVLP